LQRKSRQSSYEGIRYDKLDTTSASLSSGKAAEASSSDMLLSRGDGRSPKATRLVIPAELQLDGEDDENDDEDGDDDGEETRFINMNGSNSSSNNKATCYFTSSSEKRT